LKKKPLMMLIDDLKSSRMVIKRVLKTSYEYIEANDGLEALELLKKYTPDIILVDAIMPNMDGFETIKKIRDITQYKRVPILMITSLSNVKTKIKALEYGVNDFLTKPFDKYELRARCKSYVEMVELNKQYVDAKINPITGFQNELALIKDVIPSDKIFLIAINDFHKIKGIYGYKNSQIVEKKFGKFIIERFKKHIGDLKFFHVSSAKYVIKVNSDIDLDDNKVKEICETFYKECLDIDIFIENLQFTPITTIIYVTERVNLYEDAISALGYARLNNIKYIYSSDDINGIKNIVYSNIEVLKKVKTIIDSNNIINFYQPILDNHTEKIQKYETLVRLKSQNNELLSPMTFLDIIKNVQLYEQLTKIVYKNAFDKFKFNNYEFSINISHIDIENKIVRDYIFEILSKNPHVSNRITFEIAEDKNLKDIGLIKEFIKEIRKYEAKIAIDNYGSSYSNIQNIVQIEPDFIKIDGSIVHNIVDFPKCYTLLESINIFAQNFGVKTVAEYVSSKEIFNEVINLDIDYSQGYFIGKPSENLLSETTISI